MSRRQQRWILTVGIGLLLMLWRTWPLVSRSSASPLSLPAPTQAASVFVTGTNALVTQVIDGDTLAVRLDDQADERHVRLLGVNTPETVDPRRPVQCFGHEASAYTASHLSGRRIRLEADVQADDVDKYGRLLRNIVLPDEHDLDFNAELIRQGYAYAYLNFPLDKQRKSELRRLQAEAQQAGRGLWNQATCAGKK